jgi:hypothetical protein
MCLPYVHLVPLGRGAARSPIGPHRDGLSTLPGSTSGAGSDRLAHRPSDHVEDFFDVLVGVALFGGRSDAPLDVIFEDQQGHGIDSRPQRRRLLEDVDAVFPALDHALDPSDLTLDAPEPPDQGGLVLRVRVAERRFPNLRSTRAAGDPGRSDRTGRREAAQSRFDRRAPRIGLRDAPRALAVLCLLACHCRSGFLGPRRDAHRDRRDDTPREYLRQRNGDRAIGSGSGFAVWVGTVDAPPSGLKRIDLGGEFGRQTTLDQGAMTAPVQTGDPRPDHAFAHASEAEFARILDFYQVAWEYEPQVFPILWDLDGNVLESFAPDFYLPELDTFVEMTTLQQRLVRKKNRKVRRLRELYPGLRIKLFYARDFRALMLKYGRSALVSALSGTLGQVGSRPDEEAPGGVATSASHADDRPDVERGVESAAERSDSALASRQQVAGEQLRTERRSRAARRRERRALARVAATQESVS